MVVLFFVGSKQLECKITHQHKLKYQHANEP